MPWWSLYEAATGALRSHTSVLPETVPEGLAVLEHTDRQDQDKVWDAASRSWVPRAPEPVFDRLADLVAHPYASEIWSRLTAAQRTKLRQLLVWLLGSRRYRGQREEIPIDAPDGWPTDPAGVS